MINSRDELITQAKQIENKDERAKFIMNYLIENKKGKEAVISFIICLILTVILFYGLRIISNALYTNIPYIQFDDFEWYGLIIAYTTTFVIIYGLNYIHNKFITKKMNKELNK